MNSSTSIVDEKTQKLVCSTLRLDNLKVAVLINIEICKEVDKVLSYLDSRLEINLSEIDVSFEKGSFKKALSSSLVGISGSSSISGSMPVSTGSTPVEKSVDKLVSNLRGSLCGEVSVESEIESESDVMLYSSVNLLLEDLCEMAYSKGIVESMDWFETRVDKVTFLTNYDLLWSVLRSYVAYKKRTSRWFSSSISECEKLEESWLYIDKFVSKKSILRKK